MSESSFRVSGSKSGFEVFEKTSFLRKKIILALNFFVHEQSQLNAEISNDARLL